MNILNSDFVNYFLKLALSKSGVAVNWLVGLFIGYLVKTHIFPENDLHEIQLGLTSGLTAVVAILYGLLQWWVTHRQKDGVRALQIMTNARSSAAVPRLRVDGIAGNETVQALSNVTNVSAAHAVSLARNA